MYDLVKQELVRKLLAGAQWISCMAAHPAGDNLLVGSYDRKCVWYVSSHFPPTPVPANRTEQEPDRSVQ